MHTVEISNPLEKPAEILPVFPMERMSYKALFKVFCGKKKARDAG